MVHKTPPEQLRIVLQAHSYAGAAKPGAPRRLTHWCFCCHSHGCFAQHSSLPLVCPQVLLSQVHRLRALVLLGRFLDMGAWAVDLALSG